jgi:hypothetical protein
MQIPDPWLPTAYGHAGLPVADGTPLGSEDNVVTAASHPITNTDKMPATIRRGSGEKKIGSLRLAQVGAGAKRVPDVGGARR